MSGRPMRYFIAAGTRHHRDLAELPLAHEDVERATELFTSMGHRRVLDAVSYDPDAEIFENALADWCRTPVLTADDSVIVYYAGHGDRAPSGRYRLACANSEEGKPRSWLSLPNLAEILATSPVRNVLFVVDACYAAAATAELGPITNAIVAGRGRGDDFGAGTWLLASARHRDLAVDGAFVTEVAKACAQGDGPSQRYLAPTVIADRVNQVFIASGAAQRAACSVVDQSGAAPFFDNPSFDPHAEVTGDEEAPGDTSDLSSHFEPRGRGVEHVHDEGSYFTGRTRALREARDHLAGQGSGRLLVVTADPGSGKSAVLGRLVLEGCADASVNAHHQTMETVVARLAAAADIRASTLVALLTKLADRELPFRIVVDSLDEAGAGGNRAEARRIAWELLRPLAAVSCVRLIVGSRRDLLPHLGDRVPAIDLDDDAYADDTNTVEYVEKILSDEGAPYARCPDTVRPVAREVARRAGRCFLVARMTASALLRGPVVDVGVPGWAEQLPSDVGGAFETFLQRVPQGRHAVTMALLTALAFGEGDGLPRRIWVRVAARLSGIMLAEADVDMLLEEDGSYLARVRVDGTWYFRLYHQELTDHIKDRVLRSRDLADLQECFVDTLTELVPDGDWSRAHAYVRARLAIHAAGAGTLDDLIEDASFVVAVEPSTLLQAVRYALRRATLSMAVERYTYLLADTDRDFPDRAAVLAFVAHTYGEHALAGSAELLSTSVERVRVEPREITAHRVVGRHAGDGYSIRSRNPNWLTADLVLPDGSRTVLAAPPGASHVHVWLIDTPAQSTVLPHPARVTGLALFAGPPHPAEAVTLDAEGTLRWWNLGDQTLSRVVPGTPWTALFSAGFRSDGTPVIACGNDARVAALAVPGLDPLAEADCPTGQGRNAYETTTGTACLASDGEGRAQLLVCDGAGGRVLLYDLETPGDPDVLIDGLKYPVLATRTHGPRGTVAAVSEPWSKLHLVDTGTRQAVGAPFHGDPGHIAGFAHGSDEPVLVAGAEVLLTARMDRPFRQTDGSRVARLEAAVLHEGRLLAIEAGFGSQLRLVDCAAGERVGAPLSGHEGAVCAVRLIAAPGADGPDLLTVGNDGTARIWPWGSHERGTGNDAGGTTAPDEVQELIPWRHRPDSVMRVPSMGRHVRRVAPVHPEAELPVLSSHVVTDLTFEYDLNVHDRTEDPEGTLNLLSWQYTGHVGPETTPELPGYSPSSPVSYCVWHRLHPSGASDTTEMRWLHGNRHDRLSGWLLPPVPGRPHTRFVGFDRLQSRVRVLDTPDTEGGWIQLPWSVRPPYDNVCATAFTTASADLVVMSAVRPARKRERSVDGRAPHEPPSAAPDAVPARLWNVESAAPHPVDGIELLPDVYRLNPHHGSGGTRWVLQRGRRGSAGVIDIETGRRYPLWTADPTGRPEDEVWWHAQDRWTERSDGTPVLLYQAPVVNTHPRRDPPLAPVHVWTAVSPDRPTVLEQWASRILWAGPAPNGAALAAIGDGHGVALCHLPDGETIWYAPLPALVTALTPVPGSPAFDLAVGTQQGVVFLRPRLSRSWQRRMGLGFG
ncbi:caspase family protein [Streptomyces anulatus]|uniref:caspase family protein n=1 Tax=Streptomyces anulatus TaxID=1892 RepID=UPI00386B2027|nr:caspase family protein [Streptomyces anulatus]